MLTVKQSLSGMAPGQNGDRRWPLDPALRGASGPSNPIIVLDFTAERFHSERITSYGVFAGREGGHNRIRLRMVSPDDLAALASILGRAHRAVEVTTGAASVGPADIIGLFPFRFVPPKLHPRWRLAMARPGARDHCRLQ
jgi:hypothetical protein